MLPDFAPVSTTAVMLMSDTTVNDFALTPPKVTAVAPVKCAPVKVTVLPGPAASGVNDVRMGAGKKVNPAAIPAATGVVTEISPLAPVPTTAEILVEDLTVNEAASTPPKLTLVAPFKLVPVIVTVAPVIAESGVNEVMTGAFVVFVDTEMVLP